MKKLFFFFCLCFLGLVAQAQELPDFNYIELKEKADYAKAEGAVHQAVDYLLSTPLDPANENRQFAQQFLLKWMQGTPDFSFELDQTAVSLSKDSPEVLGLYMACATKFCLENKALAKDKKAVKLSTLQLLATYVANPAFRVLPRGELKKLLKAAEKGQLEKYVG